MSLHAFGAHSGRNAKAHELRTDERKVHQDLPTTADHKVCLERIRELRDENELLRKSADEFAALAERLQRALVRERARGGRAGTNGHSAGEHGGNRILTISMQIEAEYRSIPNLRLTRWQAARLWDLDQRECDEAIAALVRSRVLRETPGGFVRREK
jgi:hypothetical protein